jgi:hypothetical protein
MKLEIDIPLDRFEYLILVKIETIFCSRYTYKQMAVRLYAFIILLQRLLKECSL